MSSATPTIPNKARKQPWYKRRKSTVNVSSPARGPDVSKPPKRPLDDATPASGEPSLKIRRVARNVSKTPTRLGARTPTHPVKSEEEEPWYTVRRSRHDTLAVNDAADTTLGEANRMTPPLTTCPADSPLANAGPSAPTPIPAIPTPGLSIYTPIPTETSPGRPVTRNYHPPATTSSTPAHDVYEFNDVSSDEDFVPLRRASGKGRGRGRPASTAAGSTRASVSRASVTSAAGPSAAANTTTTTTTTAGATVAVDTGRSLRSRGDGKPSEASSNPALRYPPHNIKRLPFTQKRPADLVPPGAGGTIRWNQAKLKAALGAALGMSPATFMKLIGIMEDYIERPATAQHGWIWIPSPGTGHVAVEIRKLGHVDFGEELVEIVLGDDSARRALVEEGKIPLIGYLFYQTLLAAGTRRASRVRSVAAKKTQMNLVSSVLSTAWRNGQ